MLLRLLSAARVAVEEKVETMKVELREEIPAKGNTELRQDLCPLIKFKIIIFCIISAISFSNDTIINVCSGSDTVLMRRLKTPPSLDFHSSATC